jgi:hypothetical protein
MLLAAAQPLHGPQAQKLELREARPDLPNGARSYAIAGGIAAMGLYDLLIEKGLISKAGGEKCPR